MPKGAYDVNETEVGPSKDGSFRSCLCAMLVFVSICIILLLVAWPWRNSTSSEKSSGPLSDNLGSTYEQKGGKFQTTRNPHVSENHLNSSTTQSSLDDLDDYDDNSENELEFESSTVKGTVKMFERIKVDDKSTTIQSITIKQPINDKSDENLEKPSTETTMIKETTTISDEKPTTNYKINPDFTSTIKNIDKFTENGIYIKKKILTPTTTETNENPLTTSDSQLNKTKDTQLLIVETSTEDDRDETTTNRLEGSNKTKSLDNNEEITTIDSVLTTIEPKELSKTKNLNSNEQITTTDSAVLTTNMPEVLDKNEQITTIDSVVLTTNEPEESSKRKNLDRNEQITTDSTVFTTNVPEVSSETKNLDKNKQITTTDSVILTTNEPEVSRKIKNLDRNEQITTDSVILTTNEPEVSSKTKNKSILTTDEPELSTFVNSTQFVNTESTKESSYVEILMETDEIRKVEKSTAAPKDNKQKTLKPEVTSSDKCGVECKKFGARMLNRMNLTADPCEQFYEYACGGDNSDKSSGDNWSRIKDGLDRIFISSPDVYKIFRRYFDSCVQFHSDFDYNKRITEAKSILQSVGHLDENGNNVEQTKTDIKQQGNETSALTDLLTRLLFLDSSPLFDISVGVDKQSQHFIFQLNLGKHFLELQNENTIFNSKMKCIRQSKKHMQTSISLFEYIDMNEMYQVYSKCQKNTTEYKETVKMALKTFKIFTGQESEIMNDLDEILNKVEELPTPAILRKNVLLDKNEVKKVAELKSLFPLVDWHSLFQNLVGTEIDDEDFVQIYNKDLLKSILNLKMNKSSLYKTLVAMFSYELYSNLVQPMTMINQDEFCLHQSSYLMKEVASSIYLNSIDDKLLETNAKTVKKLSDKLKDILKNLFDVAEWADTSRITLRKKVDNIFLDTWKRSSIWRNISLIEERMKSVNKSFESYSKFAMALVERNRKMLYSMWDTMAYNEENVWWHFSIPYNTNPVAIYPINHIVIPPAYLIQITNNIPKYLSTSTLGYQLAKMIAYHFDTTGIKYKLSLQGKAILAYEELRTRMKSSFSNEFKMDFGRKSLEFKVTDDALSLSFNERFVEETAINLISKMFPEAVQDYPLTWLSNPEVARVYSPEKMFFVALAQEHCRKSSLEDFFLHLFESEHLPPSLLLDISLSNFDLFSDTFGCKIGARMNIEFKSMAFPEMFEPEDEYTK